MTQSCSTCGIDKDLTAFGNHPAGRNGKQSRCYECYRISDKKRYQTQPDKRGGLAQSCKAMGITILQYWDMFYQQEGRCKICYASSTQDRLVIDHDHVCCPYGSSCGRCVRGLLCHKCNLAVGLFGDATYKLTNAIDYLA